MNLIMSQLYDVGVGVLLGVILSLFYACYRLQFHSRKYSRRMLLLTDSLWWLFAFIFTAGCLFLLQWGSLRALFFLAFLLGFCLGYFLFWQPLLKKIKLVFMRAPKGYFGKKQSHMPRQGAVVVEKKQDGWVSKPFDAAAQGLYKGYAYGKGQYLTAKKKRQAITDKWKKQIDTEKQKWKHSILQALWPQNKKDDETEDVMTEEIAEIENEPIEENKKE